MIGLIRSWKIDDRDLEIMERMMLGFVMVVSGKWSKVVVFALEPAFYYLCRVCTVHGKPGKPGKRNFFEKSRKTWKTQGIL